MQPYTVVVMNRELPRPNKERVCGAKCSPGKDWALGVKSEPAAGLEQKTGPLSWRDRLLVGLHGGSSITSNVTIVNGGLK